MTVDSPLSRRYPIYTRANVAEVFPEPVPPLMLDYGIPEAEAGWRDAWYRIGALEPHELAVDSLEQLAIVGGYCYLNASLLRLFGERAPGLDWRAMDDQFLGPLPGIPPYEPGPGDVRPDLTARIGETFQRAVTIADVADVLEDQRTTLELRADRPDLASLDDGQLVARFVELVGDPGRFRHLFAQHLFASYMAAVPVGMVRAACLAADRGSAAMEILSALGDVDSARPALVMWTLSRLATGSAGLEAGFDAFIAEFGCRGPNEWDIRSPAWESHPDLALAAIDALRVLPDDADPEVRSTRLRARGDQAASEVLEALDDDDARHQLVRARRAAAMWIATRERTKANAVRLVHEARMAVRELGARMVDRGHLEHVEDYGFLRGDELEAFVRTPEAFAATVVERRRRHDELAALSPPLAFVGHAPAVTTWDRRVDTGRAPPARGTVLQGMAGSPGVAEGRARVAQDDRGALAVRPGEVLVAPLVDVSWSPAFIAAEAVVADIGAPLSHGVIVSRELGVPCVTSVAGASRTIPDGAPLRVDGTLGTVTLL